ncbi:hypothetical protein KORDIASMS9_00400 [Kordia sp. SMS9]|uniref:hypothetical protein n=1 Tax=Kordia sp. SMS9 TaxID=2282170 RepID=UPI000E0D9AFB|nr:hypothetical protein [Kordia sp. SMS9]AXG68208.1 hypothetical protein KORDIASMS9_00400 [Kordia sp. SMS9]
MIGVKNKKQSQSSNDNTIPTPVDTIPSFNLQDGQGGIYGKVTERNINSDEVRNIRDVNITVFDENTLVAFNLTSDEGIYIFDAINAPKSYTIEFRKDVVLTKEFTIASKEIKEINIEFLVNNF